MKLKIISDGTNAGTKLIDEDTGEMIHLIQKMTWEADAKEVCTKVTVEFINIPVEIVTKAEVDLIEYIDQGKSWEPVCTKTFEKEIKVISEKKSNGFPLFTTVCDAQTNEQVSAVQEIKWEANTTEIKAKVKRIKFDKKDW